MLADQQLPAQSGSNPLKTAAISHQCLVQGVAEARVHRARVADQSLKVEEQAHLTGESTSLLSALQIW